jgi:radical SAM-linked protein
MRFASHRDVARVFERGVRRAGLPIAYSAGFTPHPRISYAGGTPTGVASEAEYLSLALTSRQAAAHVRERLNATLPDGIDVIDVMDDADGPAGDILGALEASQWRVVLPGVEPAAAERAVAGFLARHEAPVERLTDKGVRHLDARAAVVTLDVLEPADHGPRDAVTDVQDCAILRMVVLHTAPAVRPDDVLTALREQHGVVPSSPPITTRLTQGSLALLAGKSALWGVAVVPGSHNVKTGNQAQRCRSRACTARGQSRRQGGSACAYVDNVLPRGVRLRRGRPSLDGMPRTRAPGSLTGDCPNARERAVRQRKQ